MSLSIAVVRERLPGESRVALVPETAKKFAALGARLRMEQSAGIESHFLDTDYAEVSMVGGIAEAYADAPLIQTLVDFSPAPYEIQWEHPTPPFHVTNQLQVILPQASLKTARRRVRYPDEIYDESKDTRYPWMKRFAWETDPYISVPWHPCYPLTSVTEIALPEYQSSGSAVETGASSTSDGCPRAAARASRSSSGPRGSAR